LIINSVGLDNTSIINQIDNLVQAILSLHKDAKIEIKFGIVMNDIAISFLITPTYKQFYASQLILKTD